MTSWCWPSNAGGAEPGLAVDTTRGPILRTSPADAVTERTEEGPDDRALRLLVRRTPSPARSGTRGGVAGGRAQPGHTRGATHRPTGK
jgi:hypothetical protein